MQIREARNTAQVSDPSRVHHGCPDVVDQLLLNELLAVPDAVEHLAHRKRRRGVLADQAEIGLILGRDGILEPEQPEWLEILAQPRGLNWRQAVVDIV